jgi:hypothetical protein
MSSIFNNVSASKPTSVFDIFKPTSPVLQSNIKRVREQFSNSSSVFLESNNLVMKFAFLIVVLVLFVILLRMGTMIIGYMMSPSKNPHLIDGMMDGKHMSVIHMDPSLKGSKPILRSVNQQDGIEFTWSLWVFIEDLEYKRGTVKHIFHKGNDNINEDGFNSPNNAPGLYLASDTNEFLVLMNTFNEIQETIVIEDIPLNKWINVIIRCEGRNLDVYINGTIVKRHVLSGVPKQNYDDVYLSMNGGFSGFTSNLWYYDYSLGLREINRIVRNGPSTTLKDTQMSASTSQSKYLSERWYLDQLAKQ